MQFSKVPVEIHSRDYWFKIVGFLQQNWALIDEIPDGCIAFFIGDTSGVFDRLTFSSVEEAETALRRNGFARFVEEKEAQGFEAQGFIVVPKPPFRE